MESYLKIVVMSMLENQPLSGYSLMQEINAATGWKPSAGSIYPILKALSNQGMVSFKQTQRKKVYMLTSAGKKYYLTLKKKRDAFIDSLKCKIAASHKLTEEEIAAIHVDVLNKSPKDSYILKSFKPILHNSMEIQKQLIRMHMQGKLKSQQKQINAILKKAVEGLRNI